MPAEWIYLKPKERERERSISKTEDKYKWLQRASTFFMQPDWLRTAYVFMHAGTKCNWDARPEMWAYLEASWSEYMRLPVKPEWVNQNQLFCWGAAVKGRPCLSSKIATSAFKSIEILLALNPGQFCTQSRPTLLLYSFCCTGFPTVSASDSVNSHTGWAQEFSFNFWVENHGSSRENKLEGKDELGPPPPSLGHEEVGDKQGAPHPQG